MSDNARGVPIGKLVDCFTEPHTGGKSKKGKSGYRSSVGLHGCGAKIAPALSTDFIAISKRDNKLGVLKSRNAKIEPYEVALDKSPETGTVVFYELDREFFPTVNQFMSSPDGFARIIDLIMFYNAYSENVIFNVRTSKTLLKPKELKELKAHDLYAKLMSVENTVTYDIGDKLTPMEYCANYYKFKSDRVWSTPKVTKEIDCDIKQDVGIEFELCLFKDFKSATCMVGSINMLPLHTPQSSHIQVVTNAVIQKLIKYITNKDMIAFVENRYKLPISGSVQTLYDEAEFTGQNKSGFSMASFIRGAQPICNRLMKQIPEETWRELYVLIEDDITEQYNKYIKRTQLSTDLSNVHLKLFKPSRYLGCRSRDNSITEIFITEGVSATSNVVKARDPNTQAIYTLGGKPLNSMKKDVIRTNQKGEEIVDEVLADLIRILGVTPNDTNLDNLNFRRIGILSDADHHGLHIAALTIGNLYEINPRIITEGRVFVTNPPLYALNVKGSKRLLMKDWCALLDTKISVVYANALDIKINNMLNGNTYKLEGAGLRDFLYYVSFVGGVMEHVATKLGISSEVLEMLTLVVDDIDNLNLDNIKNKLQLDQVTYDELYNSIIITYGKLDVPIQLHNLTKEIRAYVLPELNRISQWRNINILVSTRGTDNLVNEMHNISMLYHKLLALDKVCTVKRFKGLGEMSVEQTEYTCINPVTRSVRKILSVGDVDELYALLGVDTSARKALIMNQ